MIEVFIELLLASLGFLTFFLFRSLVDEVRHVRQELHSLNLKIADLLAKDQVLEHRLNALEKGRIQ